MSEEEKEKEGVEYATEEEEEDSVFDDIDVSG